MALLRLEGITKRFGTLVANDNVSLELAAGEVLALLGENGAGKSTLMSILFGHYVADAGHITLDGRPLPPGDTRAALAAGIGMVHQHFTLAENLSVLDNVMLGTEPLTALRTRRAAARAQLLATAQRCGLAVEPEARVATLSVGERQRVEILKALVRGARVLVLDEPTAVLTPQEAQALFATLRQLVAGGLAVIFISHKLDEVMAVARRAVVLRGGRKVAELAVAGSSAAELARHMVGTSVQGLERQPPRPRDAAQAPRLRVQGLRARHAHDRVALADVNLDIGAGEVLGIAGVSGNGQGLLARVLGGVVVPMAGHITLDGQALARDARGVVAQRVARVPEDRQAVGVVGDLPVWENLAAEALPTPVFSRWGWIRRAAALAYAQRSLQAFDVRGATPQRRTGALSGGNMQKLILARVLQRADGQAPQLIVAHQPTWGLDIGAVAFVHRQLRAACEAGAAVLLISDDLDEIELLADRIAVICHGRLTRARPAADWTREALGLAMAGTSAGPHPDQALPHAA
ncbi:ABC transporter ATP-binding protein [Aquabacterium sp. OR-4]|uniref:ABC transporter ATP-binding protein n=1 Tax=Aquabacterium sp. OR-4 TaxID=2978127 RepID=UPI0021B37B2F|nr:ABC transporter ATP-binding protein [Aquabacterium sp. OR-4]MDT7837535.1 ABC transporter ATP-binding protein [Aquabacterium sp. OR-4]